MGTWGADSFENDQALDFCDEIESLETVKSTLDGTVRYEEAEEAIVAAEVVAAMMGRPNQGLPVALSEVITGFGDLDDGLIRRAREVVEQVRARTELAELWAEDDDCEWQAAIDDLLARLDPDQLWRPPPPTATEPEADFGFVCCLCEKSGVGADKVVLTVEDELGSYTLYAHRACIIQRFDPPHFTADGSVAAELLLQFDEMMQKSL